MKVCLRRGYHHMFDELVNHPPKGVTYEIPKLVSPSKQSGFKNELKRKIWRIYANTFNQPNSFYIPSVGNADLIHSGSGFLIKNKMPWVIDLEHVASFVGFQTGRLDKVKTKVENALASPFCKKILPWTHAGEMSIRNSLDTSKFDDKIKIVYPAMTPLKVKKKKHDKTNLLFVSIRFFTKGGMELLQAYDVLKNKMDVNLTVISDVPEKLREKYQDVEFHEPNIPREKILDEYFSKADVFVLPSYMDTFGMVFLESMSAGVPIVSTNVFAIPEMIEGAGLITNVDKYSWYGKDYLFAWKTWEKFSHYVEVKKKPEVVDSLVENISTIVNDQGLKNKMIRNGREKIEKGKFSIQNRNKALKEIYEEAVL